MGKTIISPSILSADFADFGSAVSQIDESGAGWLHLDVMDGSFVSNITFGPALFRSLRARTGLYFDAHLMIVRPERHIEEFAEAGADSITFHYEAHENPVELLKMIRKLNVAPGITIVPETPVSVLEKVLPYIDLALIMTVPPGYGGQQLIPQCLKKVETLVKMREKTGFSFKISVDGGINGQTARQAKEAGADVLVIGSSFFACGDKRGLVQKLQSC